MSKSMDRPINRYGLTDIFRPDNCDANVDIVLVHGLNGHPQRTWTSEKRRVFWPSQLLPPVIEEEKARILVYGYDADVMSFTDGVSRDKIHNHAEHLIAELCANRRIRKATERPIVFIAHSLGGLVVKRALIYSSEVRGSHTEHLRSIHVSTYGILFLGTPHMGADLASWCSRLQRICGVTLPAKLLDGQPQLVTALMRNCETLLNIDRHFIQLIDRYHIYFFHEGKPTEVGATRQYIVEEDSAAPVIQDVERACIQQDHARMCKFEDENTPGFSLVAEGIQRYAAEAPAIIERRWEAEKLERQRQKEAAAKELFGFTEDTNLQETSAVPARQIPKQEASSDSGPVQRSTTSEPQHFYYFNFLNFFSANRQSHTETENRQTFRELVRQRDGDYKPICCNVRVRTTFNMRRNVHWLGT